LPKRGKFEPDQKQKTVILSSDFSGLKQGKLLGGLEFRIKTLKLGQPVRRRAPYKLN